MKKIWVLENEAKTLSIYEKLFQDNFETKYFKLLDELRLALQNEKSKPDLLITNLLLPDGNFENQLLDVCLKLEVPFAAVSESDDLEVLKAAFERGALDVWVKPISGNKTLFKVNKLIEENEAKNQLVFPKFGELTLDPFDQQVTRESFPTTIPLTQTEYKILALLFTKVAPRLERTKIISRVWERTVQSSRVFDFHLSKLREKLRKVSVKIELAKEGYCLLLE